jgi:purine nucleosidase
MLGPVNTIRMVWNVESKEDSEKFVTDSETRCATPSLGKHIVLDTDVGTDADDSLALALAAASPELSIEGVTTVHADAPLRARIARRLLDLAGRPDVPVVAGASLPLAEPLPAEFHWHPRLWGHEGRGLLDEEGLKPTINLQATADDAANFIVEKAAAMPGRLSLVMIGPLTNLARALRMQPRLRDWISDVTIMGGMVDTRSVIWPPVLETNLNADPCAAEEVFASGLPLTLVPFEVTTRVFLTPVQRAEMRGWQHPLSNALVALMQEMLAGFAQFSERMHLPADIFAGDMTYMHDPLAVYTSMCSDLVDVQPMYVRLEVHDSVLRTVAYANRTPNMRVCTGVQSREFVAFWMNRVRALITQSR